MRLANCVLTVVDVQNGFLTPETRHILPVLIDLAARWSKLDGATVYSRYFNYPHSPFERLIGWKKIYTSPETDIAEDLLPYARNATMIDKRTYSALTPDFDDLIHRHHWTDIALCGIDTELCVLKTALDVFDRDLTPWVITNASASTAGNVYHEAGLKVLGRAIGPHHLVTTKELLMKVC